MNKVTFRTERCKGCGLCVDVCPKKILALDTATLNGKGYHPAVIVDHHVNPSPAHQESFANRCKSELSSSSLFQFQTHLLVLS